MDGKDGLILWTLGGAGVLFLYSAYANKSPRTVLATTLGAKPPTEINPVLHEKRGNFGEGVTGSFDGSAGGFGSGTTGSFDASGSSYFFDMDGNIAGLVPTPYQGTAATYIPPRGGLINA